MQSVIQHAIINHKEEEKKARWLQQQPPGKQPTPARRIIVKEIEKEIEKMNCGEVVSHPGLGFSKKINPVRYGVWRPEEYKSLTAEGYKEYRKKEGV